MKNLGELLWVENWVLMIEPFGEIGLPVMQFAKLGTSQSLWVVTIICGILA